MDTPLIGNHPSVKKIQEFISLLGNYFLGQVNHIAAQVTLGGHLGLNAQALLVAGVERAAKGVYLVAGIVNVVFRLGLVAGSVEDIGQGAAQNSPPPVPHMEWPGGINADKLYLYPATLAQLDIAVSITGLKRVLPASIIASIFDKTVAQTYFSTIYDFNI